MWRGVGIGLVVGIAGLAGYLLHVAHTGGIAVHRIGPPVELSYADFVAILLTGFGIIIAVAGVALATAGIVGWNSIESKAMSIAEKVTKSNIEDENGRLHALIKDAVANPNSPLHNTLKAEIQRFMFEGIMNVESDDDEPSPPTKPTTPRMGGRNAA